VALPARPLQRPFLSATLPSLSRTGTFVVRTSRRRQVTRITRSREILSVEGSA
jgi:hypothetical protein